MTKALLSVLVFASVATAFNMSNLSINLFGPCHSGSTTNTTVCQEVTKQYGSNDPIVGVITAAMEVISFLAGAAAVILILVASIQFITSGGSKGGDSGAVKGAKSSLTYALVGLAVTVLSQLIIVFVLDKIG